MYCRCHSLNIMLQTLCDPIQSDRLDLVIDGRADGVDGLLTLVNSCQSSDSCRAYQAVKVLVTASSKCPAVRERLLQEPARWQTAVNWLKSKMSESVSSYWSPSGDTENDIFKFIGIRAKPTGRRNIVGPLSARLHLISATHHANAEPSRAVGFPRCLGVGPSRGAPRTRPFSSGPLRAPSDCKRRPAGVGWGRG